MKIQLKMQMARLQVSETRLSSPEKYSSNPSSRPWSSPHSRHRSPVAWQELAQNPKAHDDIMRDALLLDLTEDNAQDNGGDTPTATPKEALENIQETFIPVSNVDGRRVQGKKLTTDVRQELQRKAQSKAPNQGKLDRGGFGTQTSRPSSHDTVLASDREARPRQQQDQCHIQNVTRSGAQYPQQPSPGLVAQDANDAESLINFDEDPVNGSLVGHGMIPKNVPSDTEGSKKEEPESLLIDLS